MSTKKCDKRKSCNEGRHKYTEKRTKPDQTVKNETGTRQSRGTMGNLLNPYSSKIYTQRETKDLVLFWQKGSPFSQWYPSVFTVDDLMFNCAEQFMMYHKTRLCDSEELTKKVLTSIDPEEQKRIGREAGQHSSFRREKWESICRDVVKQGNIAKNRTLKDILLKTEKKTLAEASPFDTKWGIGMAANHRDVLNENKWQGRNLLGKILMEVREELLEDQKK